ncbi:TonB-dependent receptor [Pseudocolwellia sp. AS88]|uniref:TonB-dependent receptor n=1 Tax=Pseudocolwellia sp. AS88 TaxID=3063958 RepID=UPI0026F2FE26|nr:TonB-dependent receptor [Pseudocolwellia sp. AS88]MDO7085581.1 TonB-dependent receptor [Pseudocolwellia sp. AS88]
MKTFVALLLTLICIFRCEAFTQNEIKKLIHFDIKKMVAEESLITFAEQANIDSIFHFENVKGKITNRVIGEYTVNDALKSLVENTELTAKINMKGQMIINTNIKENSGNMMIKKSTLASAVLSALAGITTLPTIAETEAKEVEIIEVKGIRSSILKAQHLKRNADSVIDAISADDLGKFSDAAISDAMQRIPGVQVERNDGGQEGDRVSIRGLGATYVTTTVSGRTALSSGTEGLSNLRAFNLEVIPTDVITSVIVKKTPTASDPESGLAGSVDLQTRKPLDNAQYTDDSNIFGSLTIQGDKGSIGKEQGTRFSGLFGQRSDDGKLGYYVAYLNSESHPGRDQLFPQVSQRDLNLDTTGDGLADTVAEDVYTIHKIDIEPIREDRLRESIAAALQWKASDNLEIIADVIYTSYDNSSIRNRVSPVFSSAFDNGVLDASKIYIDDSNTLQSIEQGAFLGDQEITTQFIPFLYGNKTESTVAGINFKYNITSDLTMNADFHYSGVDYEQDLDLPILVQDIPASQVSFNNDNGLYSVDLGDVPLDEYRLQQGLSLIRDIFLDAEQYGARFDFNLSLNSSWLESVEFGVRWTSEDTDSIRGNTGSVTTDYTDAELEVISIAGIDQSGTAPYGFYPDDNVFSEFPLGDLSVFYDAIPNLGKTIDLGSDPSSSFSYQEDVLALYAEGNMVGVIGDMDYSANFGVRAVYVDFAGQGSRVETDGSITPTSTSSDYIELLPSANFNLDITDNLVWRLAAAKVMSRPNPSDLVPREAANQPLGVGNIPTGQRGNADLDPTISYIFDTTLAYYNDMEGAYVASFFYKDVNDFIFPVTTQDTLPGYGDQIYDVRRPENYSDGDVLGFELGFNQPFTFLPEPFDGLGLQANYTYSDSSFDEDVGDQGYGFPGSSKNNFNSIIYFEKGDFGVRLSYIYRDAYFRNLPGQGAQAKNATPLWSGDDERININASYNINEHFSIFVDVNNLTEEGRRDFYLDESIFNGSFRRERTMTVGITGRL